MVGKTLTHDRPEGRTSGRIVETEAYPVGDPAAHAFVGMTQRNRSLFRERGHCYVYLGYGVSWLANVSSESDGVGAGVLLRALEPLEGIELMRLRRGREPLTDLASGPGKLCMAMDIHRGQDGVDLCGHTDTLWLGKPRSRSARSASRSASASPRPPTSRCASSSAVRPFFPGRAS